MRERRKPYPRSGKSTSVSVEFALHARVQAKLHARDDSFVAGDGRANLWVVARRLGLKPFCDCRAIKNNEKLRYFAIDKNFKVIKKYNNSDYYALIVGDLANKIKNIY